MSSQIASVFICNGQNPHVVFALLSGIVFVAYFRLVLVYRGWTLYRSGD